MPPFNEQGDTIYYLRDHPQYISSNVNCNVYDQMDHDTGCNYFNNYGNKSCNIYVKIENSGNLSDIGQTFFQNTRQCLQDEAIKNINKTDSCTILNDRLVQSHESCYLDGPISIFDLPIKDEFTIFWNATKDFSTIPTMYNILKEYPAYLLNKIQSNVSNNFNEFSNNIHLVNDVLHSININTNHYSYNISDNTINNQFSTNNLNLVNNVLDNIYTSEQMTFMPFENNSIELNNISDDIVKSDDLNNIPTEQNLTSTVVNVNEGLQLLNIGFNHSHLSIEQITFQSTAVIIEHIKNNFTITNQSDQNLAVGMSIGIDLLQNGGHIKIDHVLMDICQQYCPIPLNGIRQLCVSLCHHGRDMHNAIKSLIIDGIIYEIPGANLAYLVYQAALMLKSIINHHSVVNVNINGISAVQTESGGPRNRTVRLTNNILGINIKNTRSHFDTARKDSYNEFNKLIKTRVYEVYGIDASFFKEDKTPKTRFEKYKRMLFFKLTNDYWKDVNNLTDEQRDYVDRKNNESQEEQERRLKFKILEKKMTYLETNKDKNIFTFLMDLKNDFMKCNNNTEIIEFMYSLFFETGNTQDNQFHFSTTVSYFLEFFNIDVSTIEEYINHQKDMSDKDLKNKTDSEKQKEQDEYNKFLINLRNLRNKGQNQELDNYLNDNKKEYTREEVMKFAHVRLFKYEISAGFIFNICSSSIVSNLVFSTVYIDYEYLKFKNNKLSYVQNKTKEIISGIMQCYFSTVISNHISLHLSLMPIFDDITDDIFQNIINPNISLGTSLFTSYTYMKMNGKLENKNCGRQIYDMIENVLKTNSTCIVNNINNFDCINYVIEKCNTITTNIITYINNFDCINYVIEKCNTIITYINSFDCVKSVIEFLTIATTIKTMFLTMITSRIIRSIIFPEVKQYEINNKNKRLIKKNKDIAEINKYNNELLSKLSDNKISTQIKNAVVQRLRLQGIIKYKIIIRKPKPKPKPKICNIHSSHCGISITINNFNNLIF